MLLVGVFSQYSSFDLSTIYVSFYIFCNFFFFCSISLGGTYNQSDIRGHRKTYLGAMPGRIIQALKTTGVNNPVLLLDEVDKVVRPFFPSRRQTFNS